MLKLTLAVLAVALAGTASAAGWRSMRIDASSEADFTASVSALRDELPEKRRHVLDLALNDIWVRGAEAAAAEQRDYVASEYFRRVDGLRYKEIVTLTDLTGEKADRWHDQVRAQLNQRQRSQPSQRTGAAYSQERYIPPGSLDGANQRGGVAQIERNNEWASRQNQY
jgi:hypothetical protein